MPGSGSGLRFLAGSGSGFNEYGSETLVSPEFNVLKCTVPYVENCCLKTKVGHEYQKLSNLSLFKKMLNCVIKRTKKQVQELTHFGISFIHF